jgi:hypothetical protein
VKFNMKAIAVVSAVAATGSLIHNAAATEVTVSIGAFHGGPHAPADTARGGVSLVRLDNGRYELRLEKDFDTTKGPDLYVYLSALQDPKDDKIVAENAFVDAGKLRSPTGGQRFRLPADFDPSRFKSVTVWCKEFGILFGAATLVAK